MRGATTTPRWQTMPSLFQSTLLMRGATPFAPLTSSHCGFQSTLLMRGATRASKSVSPSASFQSTLLMRGATGRLSGLGGYGPYFNPRSSCEERPEHSAWRTLSFRISIHAPHARSDNVIPIDVISYYNFNPRSSCEERHGQRKPSLLMAIFQSTLLMRGATFGVKVQCFLHLFQSTLLMRGATAPLEHPHDHRRISIHAPHARSDGLYSKVLELMPKFQSTLLMRGATLCWRSIAA